MVLQASWGSPSESRKLPTEPRAVLQGGEPHWTLGRVLWVQWQRLDQVRDLPPQGQPWAARSCLEFPHSFPTWNSLSISLSPGLAESHITSSELASPDLPI